MSSGKISHASIKVNGQSVLAVADGLGKQRNMALEILAESGIHSPQQGEWYSQQLWFDAFRKIAARIGEEALRDIGRSIPQNADFPAAGTTLHDALAAIDIAYHMNHSQAGKLLYDVENGKIMDGIGHYKYESTGETSGTISACNPYPCEFDRGIIEGVVAGHSKIPSARTDVRHLVQEGCREHGDRCCKYHISW